MKFLTIVLVVTVTGTSSYAQNRFSCSVFERGACLGSSETVCSTYGKCVDEDATCFSSYTCNYEGFVCKSTLTNAVGEYDELVEEYNDLLGRKNELAAGFSSLSKAASKADEKVDWLENEKLQLEQEIENLKYAYEKQNDEIEELKHQIGLLKAD